MKTHRRPPIGWRNSLLTVKRDEHGKTMPWLDWYLANNVGSALVWLGRRALDRGDAHLFNHTVAPLRAGNTDGFHEDCPLDTGAMPLADFRFVIDEHDQRIEVTR